MESGGLRFSLGHLILFALFLIGSLLLGWGKMESSLWLTLLTASVLFGWLWMFGKRGAGNMSQTLYGLGAVCGLVAVILAFVFVGWKEGIGAILAVLGGGFLGTLTMGLIRGRIET